MASSEVIPPTMAETRRFSTRPTAATKVLAFSQPGTFAAAQTFTVVKRAITTRTASDGLIPSDASSRYSTSPAITSVVTSMVTDFPYFSHIPVPLGPSGEELRPGEDDDTLEQEDAHQCEDD